jgi:hypothetical protein
MTALGGIGTDGLGGGGGGGRTGGGRGGNGVVIISYTSPLQYFNGGTVSQVGAKWIHKFTSSGTFAVI